MTTTAFPDLARFLTSNAQWAQDVGSAQPAFFSECAKGQAPKVLWIGCADSRVPESVIMACKPGDIFVHRNIANQFHLDDDSAHSVLAYAVNALGVEHVVVVGHTCCGGVAGAFEAAKATGGKSDDTPLNRWLTPLTTLAKSHMDSLPADKPAALKALVEANVKVQVANVVQNAVIQDAWAQHKKVSVHGWVYGLEDGRLRDLGVSHAPPA